MKLSTKGRYGLRALIDLAQYSEETPVSITSISKRQDISERYLEQLMSMLKKAGIVKSIRLMTMQTRCFRYFIPKTQPLPQIILR